MGAISVLRVLCQLSVWAMVLFSGLAHASQGGPPIDPIRQQLQRVLQSPSLQSVRDLNDWAMQGTHAVALTNPIYANEIQQVARKVLKLAPHPISRRDAIAFPTKEDLYVEVLGFFKNFPVSLKELPVSSGGSSAHFRLVNFCSLCWAFGFFRKNEFRSLVDALDDKYKLQVYRNSATKVFLTVQPLWRWVTVRQYSVQLYQSSAAILHQRYQPISLRQWYFILGTCLVMLPVLSLVALYKGSLALAGFYSHS